MLLAFPVAGPLRATRPTRSCGSRGIAVQLCQNPRLLLARVLPAQRRLRLPPRPVAAALEGVAAATAAAMTAEVQEFFLAAMGMGILASLAGGTARGLQQLTAAYLALLSATLEPAGVSAAASDASPGTAVAGETAEPVGALQLLPERVAVPLEGMELRVKVAAVRSASLALGALITSASLMERLAESAAAAVSEAAAAADSSTAVQVAQSAAVAAGSAPVAVSAAAADEAPAVLRQETASTPILMPPAPVAVEEAPAIPVTREAQLEALEAVPAEERQEEAAEHAVGSAPAAEQLVTGQPAGEFNRSSGPHAGRQLLVGSWQPGSVLAHGRQLSATSWPATFYPSSEAVARAPVSCPAAAGAAAAVELAAAALQLANAAVDVAEAAAAVREEEAAAAAFDDDEGVVERVEDAEALVAAEQQQQVAEEAGPVMVEAAADEQPEAVAFTAATDDAAEQEWAGVAAVMDLERWQEEAAEDAVLAELAVAEESAGEVEPSVAAEVATAEVAPEVAPNGDAVRPGSSVEEATKDVEGWIEAWNGGGAEEQSTEPVVEQPGSSVEQQSAGTEQEGLAAAAAADAAYAPDSSATEEEKEAAEAKDRALVGPAGAPTTAAIIRVTEPSLPGRAVAVLAALTADAPVAATPVAVVEEGISVSLVEVAAEEVEAEVTTAGQPVEEAEEGQLVMAAVLDVTATAVAAEPSPQEREAAYKARIAAVLAESKLAAAHLHPASLGTSSAAASAAASQAHQLQQQAQMRSQHLAMRSKHVDCLQGAPRFQARVPVARPSRPAVLQQQARQAEEAELLARSNRILQNLVDQAELEAAETQQRQEEQVVTRFAAAAAMAQRAWRQLLALSTVLLAGLAAALRRLAAVLRGVRHRVARLADSLAGASTSQDDRGITVQAYTAAHEEPAGEERGATALPTALP